MSDEIQYADRMSDTDALMWNIEKDPALRSTITMVIEFDQTIDRERLVQRFERMTRVIPRFRQRVRGNPLSIAPPRWETDPHFDLHFHLWWVKAPKRGATRDLLSIAEPIAMSGFDRARPLWRAVMVEGLAGGRCALIMKVHHAITDGVGGMKMQMELLDVDRDAPEREMPPVPETRVMSQPERFVDALDHESRRQLSFLRRSGSGLSGLLGAVAHPASTAINTTEMVSSLGRTLRPASHPLSPLMTGRSLSTRFDVMTLSLAAAKRSAKSVGGTLNDAFVGGICRGLYHYHLDHGVDIDELRMAIPINVRTAEQAQVAGNAFIPARIEVPVDAVTPEDTMREIHELVDSARAEPANDLVQPASAVLNRLPTSAQTALFGSMVKSVDFTSSNVPGAPFPVYLAGAEMTAQYPFGPLAGAAINVTLLSYQDDLNIGVASDPAAVPDPDRLMAALEQGFDEILGVGAD